MDKGYLSQHSQLRQIYGLFNARMTSRDDNESETMIAIALHIKGIMEDYVKRFNKSEVAHSPIQGFAPYPGLSLHVGLSSILNGFNEWLSVATSVASDVNSSDFLVLAVQVLTDLNAYLTYFGGGEIEKEGV